MRDYRVELISTDPKSEHRFVVYHQGINEHEVAKELNREYNPFGFEVDRGRVTDIMTNAEIKTKFGVEQNDL